MALTKISGSILKDPLNLGEVSIGGTLTYQDVTNVDSVGLITARSGIDCNGDLTVGTGVTALTNGNVSIGGTFEIFESSGIANRNFSQFKLSNFSISQFQNTGSYLIKNSSTGQLIIGGGSGGNGGVALYNNNLSAKYLRTHSEGSVEIFHDNTLRIETSGIGATVYGQLNITTGANSFETSANVFKGASGQKGVYLRSALSSATTPSYSSVDDTNTGIFFTRLRCICSNYRRNRKTSHHISR
tara:strand:+ start:872 stop:1600 length:729 start_codon:yes stop_codon:yes gene_type:complete